MKKTNIPYKFKKQPINSKIKLWNNQFIRLLIKEFIRIIMENEIDSYLKLNLSASLRIIIESNRLLGKGNITSGITLSREALELLMKTVHYNHYQEEKFFTEYKEEIINNQEKFFGINVFDKIPSISDKANTLQEVYKYFTNIAHPDPLKDLLIKIESSPEDAMLLGGYYRNNNIFILSIIAGYLDNIVNLNDKDTEIISNLCDLIMLTYLQYIIFLSKKKRVYNELLNLEYSNSLLLRKYNDRLKKSKDVIIETTTQFIKEFDKDSLNIDLINEVYLRHRKMNKDLLKEEMKILYNEGFLHKQAYDELKGFISHSKKI
jgi:hypothetical protein